MRSKAGQVSHEVSCHAVGIPPEYPSASSFRLRACFIARIVLPPAPPTPITNIGLNIYPPITQRAKPTRSFFTAFILEKTQASVRSTNEMTDWRQIELHCCNLFLEQSELHFRIPTLVKCPTLLLSCAPLRNLTNGGGDD